MREIRVNMRKLRARVITRPGKIVMTADKSWILSRAAPERGIKIRFSHSVKMETRYYIIGVF